MSYQESVAALAAESERLAAVAAMTDDAAFGRPSPCPPWTAAELLWHIRNAMTRVVSMLAAPVPPGDGLVPGPGYYRAGQRFSATVNAERVHSAQTAAAAFPDAATRVRDFTQARADVLELLRATPADRPVLTRHGDRMLLAEFTRTRVLELAVHGLDLANALGRPPWMTPAAAQVTQNLLLSPATATELRSGTGWDQVTLVAKLTGRAPLSAAEQERADSVGFRPLALG